MSEETLWAGLGIIIIVLALELTPRLGAALLVLTVGAMLIRARAVGWL